MKGWADMRSYQRYIDGAWSESDGDFVLRSVA
jgi:hypothetical protein